MLDSVKGALATVGEYLPATSIRTLEDVYNYLSFGHWMKVHGFHSSARFSSREDIFRFAANRIGNQRVLYLEFGVWMSDATRLWAQLLKNPASVLHGFDTFEGLPEDWTSDYPRGSFSTGGQMPAIDDPRVRFFKGLFEDTLRDYRPPEHEVMFMNCDADMYSSARTVLKFATSQLKSGDYLYFDEFHEAHDERRAFSDFLTSAGARFSLVGVSLSRSHVLFEMT